MTEAKTVMEDVGREMAGVELPVVLKGLAPPLSTPTLLAEAGAAEAIIRPSTDKLARSFERIT